MAGSLHQRKRSFGVRYEREMTFLSTELFYLYGQVQSAK